MKNGILLNNSRNQHHFKAFTSATTFPHATLQSAQSSDEVTSRETDDLDKLRLLREADEKWDFIKQLKKSAPFRSIYLSLRVLTLNITKHTVVR